MKSINNFFHCVVDDVLQLKFIFMIRVSCGEMTEFLSELEALVNVFRRHEILCDLDAAVEVEHLVSRWG